MILHRHPQVLLAGIFNEHAQAARVLEQLIEKDFPMDRVSLLGRAGGQGDDFLGVSYRDTEQRMKIWGLQGAAWGALLGLLAGAAGVFVVPGLGAVMVAGPLVEALGGAVLGGAGMAGAAAVTQLAATFHRMGMPADTVDRLHQAIEDGKYLLILHADTEAGDDWKEQLEQGGAEEVMSIPLGASESSGKTGGGGAEA